jgi:hypothetical protein
VRRLLTEARAAASAFGRVIVRDAIALAGYPGRLAVAAARGWHRFFFTPADPTTLGLIRILVGALVLWNFLTLGLDLQSNLGNDGWVDAESLRKIWQARLGSAAWSLWLVIPDGYLRTAWAIGSIILALFTVGLASRVTAVLAWVIMISTARRTSILFFGFDGVVVSWLFYLAVTGASGQALSLDRLLGRRGRPGPPPAPTVSANLALRLIQLNLCLIYAAAGLAKLQGAAWWNGQAVLMILLSPSGRGEDLTWLAAYPDLINLLTHATVALELLYPVLVWVKPLRPLMILGMVGLHIGIDRVMGLTEFSLAMIAGNLAFITGAQLRGRFRPARTPAPTPPPRQETSAAAVDRSR